MTVIAMVRGVDGVAIAADGRQHTFGDCLLSDSVVKVRPVFGHFLVASAGDGTFIDPERYGFTLEDARRARSYAALVNGLIAAGHDLGGIDVWYREKKRHYMALHTGIGDFVTRAERGASFGARAYQDFDQWLVRTLAEGYRK